MSTDDTDEITVLVAFGAERIPVRGRLVMPGLAVVPSRWRPEDRFTLVHTVSGSKFLGDRCLPHINQAADLAATLSDQNNIHWGVGKEELLGDTADRERLVQVLREIQNTIGLQCRERACGDPGAPSWSVRCVTCNWEWEDDYNEGPLDEAEAKRLADDHECEPEVQVRAPGDNTRWVTP